MTTLGGKDQIIQHVFSYLITSHFMQQHERNCIKLQLNMTLNILQNGCCATFYYYHIYHSGERKTSKCIWNSITVIWSACNSTHKSNFRWKSILPMQALQTFYKPFKLKLRSKRLNVVNCWTDWSGLTKHHYIGCKCQVRLL